MGRKKHLDHLLEFENQVEKLIPIERMILFGSRANKKSTRRSDFDLILVSPAFRKTEFRKRSLQLYDCWNLDYPVDFLCYTPEEFKKLSKQVSLVSQAIKEGIEIK
ncbi:MAG: nucleotidyltransferase domain-containing protein [Nanoarchaeota archaeon]